MEVKEKVGFGKKMVGYEINQTSEGKIYFVAGEQSISDIIFMDNAVIYGNVPLRPYQEAQRLPTSAIGVCIIEIDSSRDYGFNHFRIKGEIRKPIKGLYTFTVVPFSLQLQKGKHSWIEERDNSIEEVPILDKVFIPMSGNFSTFKASKDAELVELYLCYDGVPIAKTPKLALPGYKLEIARSLAVNMALNYNNEEIQEVKNMSPALFGTSGVRGPMGYILTADAVRATSQAMIDLIQENNISGPIIVGGDTRFLSEEFAKTAAEIFAGNADAFSKSGEPAVIFMDIPTGNFDSEGNPERKPYVPTPAMTFAIRKYNAAGGVTMTASHNFGEDNGYKSLREHYGGLAPQRVTIALQDRANSLLKNNSIMRYTSFEKACRLNKIQKVNIRDAYFEEHLMSLVDFNVISKSEPNVAVDLLYGTGIGFLDKILELAGCRIKKCYHNWRDPNFGGRRPDCEDENNIHEMVEFVKTNSDVEVGLSVDSDGDRFGVVGKKGLINANHIIAMLFYYLFHFKNNKSLPVCRTIVTTHMLDAMAKKLGVKILALPYIGFKWIGDMMNDEKMSFIIAGEESSGLSIGNFPEKDGILADILVLEMICKIGQDEVTSEKRTGRKIKPLHELLEQLQEEFGAWHFHRRDLYGIRRKQKVMDFFRKKYRPKEIAGHQMENSSIIAGMFDKFKKKGRPIDENPWGINPLVGDGVKYYLKIRPEDQWKYDDGVVGAWVHIRESGNEPVIRIYTQHRTNRHALNEIEEEIERLIWKIDIQI